MATITDAAIRAAVKAGKARRLSDGQGRGSGRLVLVITRTASGVSASWYAQQWLAGKRQTALIGKYPGMTLAAARAHYSEAYADQVQAGRPVRAAPQRRQGTVADLFAAYCDHLQRRQAPSAAEIRARLDLAAASMGPDRPAREITPPDVVAHLRPIFQRGAASLADHDRAYIRAAFGWGLRSEHDYRAVTVGQRFYLTANPAADIPAEPKNPGTRFLSPDEFRELWRWLDAGANRCSENYRIALQLVMLTGQRSREIMNLRAEQWDSAERMLSWDKTKNGRPHAIPVCDQAAALLDSLVPRDGWLFPAMRGSGPANAMRIYAILQRHTPGLTCRDLRRTWKTLAGQAGLSKDDRDRLQNHSRQDVSSRHYDRYEYLPEKRAAVALWGRWVAGLTGTA